MSECTSLNELNTSDQWAVFTNIHKLRIGELLKPSEAKYVSS